MLKTHRLFTGGEDFIVQNRVDSWRGPPSPIVCQRFKRVHLDPGRVQFIEGRAQEKIRLGHTWIQTQPFINPAPHFF
jgi:hypothetical protein